MLSALNEALKAEGVVKEEPKAAAPAPESAKVEGESPAVPPTPPAEEPPSDPLKRSFEKLAKEKEALRKEAETVKPYMEMLKAIPPHSLQALARAAQSGDPMALLAAAGFSYADVAKRVVTGDNVPQAKPEEPKAPAANLPPEIQAKLAKLDQVEAYVAQQQRNELMQKVQAAVPEKLKLVKQLGAFDMVERYVSDFYQRTGSLPGETFEQTIAVAAEAVEAHLVQEAQRWSKVLTPGQPPATVASEAPRESPHAGPASTPVPKTITNATTAPAAVKPEPRTRAEILKELESDPAFINSL